MSTQPITSVGIPEDEATTVKIDPNGDVLLEIPLEQGKTRLLVSSHCLGLASPVFSTMFNSRMKEGINNRPPSLTPYPLPLPEDDPEAMTLLCNIIHHRVVDIPRNPSLTCLKKLAVLCNKYDCLSICSAWGELWLAARMEPSLANEFNELLCVAYILDIPEAFSRISWKILEAQRGSFVSLPGLTDHELIPSHLLGMWSRLSA
jgi:hypothetical protein